MKQLLLIVIMALGTLLTSAQSNRSTQNANRSTDIIAFDLKGKVKSCEWIENEWLCRDESFQLGEKETVVNFDSKGRIISPHKIERDGRGKIISIIRTIPEGEAFAGGTQTITYKYLNNGKVKEKSRDGSRTVYSYDANGRITKAQGYTTDFFFGTENESYPKKYVYTKIDSHGNWTERKVIYMVNNFLSSSQDADYEKTSMEKRIITYYE